MKKFIDILRFIKNREKLINEYKKIGQQELVQKLKAHDLFSKISETSEQDIFIVGFPKSGNTWMQSIVSGLLYCMDTSLLPDKLAQEIVPDVHARSFYKRFTKFNFFKSHLLPQKQYKRVIYIVRDGKDALISYYFFLKDLGSKVSLDSIIKNGDELFPSFWHIHVNEWLENRYHSDIIYIRYEDLLISPMEELKKICKFAGLERSDEILKMVINGNSFEKMKEKAKNFDGVGHINWLGEKGVKFFRNGKIGDHKNHMTEEQIEFFNNLSKKELQKFNYL